MIQLNTTKISLPSTAGTTGQFNAIRIEKIEIDTPYTYYITAVSYDGWITNITELDTNVYIFTYSANESVARGGTVRVQAVRTGTVDILDYEDVSVTQDEVKNTEYIYVEDNIMLPDTAGQRIIEVDYNSIITPTMRNYEVVQVEPVQTSYTAEFLNTDKTKIKLSYNANYSVFTKKSYLIIKMMGFTPTTYLYKVIHFTQEKPKIYKEVYMCEDAVINVDAIDYKLTDTNDNIIYNGVLPQQTNDIYLNDILKNDIHQNLNTLTVDEWQDTKGAKQYKLYLDDVYTYDITALNDWSYSGVYDDLISEPVEYTFTTGQILPISFKKLYDTQTLVVSIILYNDNGTVISSESTQLTGVGTFAYLLDIPNNCAKVVVNYTDGGSVTYKRICKKDEYNLIYRNLRGGYDSCLFNRTSKETDNMENSQIELFNYDFEGKHNIQYIQRKVSRSYSLKSHILNDLESIKFAELLKSNEVYLQRLGTDDLTPVIITDAKTDVKTYYNNGKKPIQYTITVKDSRNRYSR